jgi:hypothetical protein
MPGITMHSMAELITFCTKFPQDEYDVLVACAEAEKLRRADIVRRAVREYAKQLGISVAPNKKPKRK